MHSAPTIDPDARHLLELLAALGRPRTQDLPVADARAAMLAGRPILQPPPVDVAECRDFAIAGEAGWSAISTRMTASAAPSPRRPGAA
jgi:hypothetical protein